MIRKCYLVMVALIISVSSRGEHANVQSSVVGESTGMLIRNGSGSVSLFSVGDPSIFGENSWNVYAWNSTNSDSWNVNYAGYYVDTNVSMNTLNYWGDGGSPSDAPGYLGDPVSGDFHSFSAKRQGFPYGYYSISIRGHDDWAYLLIDGVEVWNHEDCCDEHLGIWYGLLTDTSRIEFKVMEFDGGSYGYVELVYQGVQASATSNFVACYNQLSTVTVTAAGGFPPYVGTGTFSALPGYNEFTVYDSLGYSSTIEVLVPGPDTPDTLITTNILPQFCQGDSVVLSASSHGRDLSINYYGTRAFIPINSPETNYTFEIDIKTSDPYAGISSVRDADLGGSHDRNLYLQEGEIYHRLYSEEVIHSTGENFADGQWHHIAVVVEAGVGQRIYVDGIEVASGTMDHSDFDWDNIINIGFSDNWYSGEIDNVRLWDVVRSPSEIQQDQTLHVIGSLPNLIGNWNFDESNGSEVLNTVDNTLGVYTGITEWAQRNTNTYLWSNGETTQSITSTVSGIYTVQITDANGCVINTPPVELVANSLPAIPVILSSSALTFCEGGEAILETNSAESKLWFKDGQFFEEDTLDTYRATETGEYSVLVTNAAGCTGSSAPQHVEVVPGPDQPTIVAASATTFCDGGQVELSVVNGVVNRRWASSVIAFSTEWDSLEWGSMQALGKPDVYPVYDDIEFAWSPSTEDSTDEFLELGFSYAIPINFIDIYETLGSGSVDSVYVKNPGTGEFELVYSAVAEYAGDTARILHITFPMTAFPVSEVRIHLNSPAIEGWNEIDAVSVGNDLPATYEWSNGDTTDILNASSSGIYTVRVTNTIGCDQVSEPIEITVHPNPVVTVGPALFTGECQSAYVLTSGQPAGGVYSGTSISNGSFDPSIGAGVYQIEYLYEDSNGCTATANTPMTVTAAPAVSLSAFSAVCSDAMPFTLTGGLPAGGTYSGTGVANGIFDPSVGTGVYSITYTFEDSMSCSNNASQDITVDICSGVSKIESDDNVSIFPNPAQGKFVVDFNVESKVNLLEIYSVTGSLVYLRTIEEEKGISHLEVELKNYSAGSYIIRIISDKGIVNKRLMLE